MKQILSELKKTVWKNNWYFARDAELNLRGSEALLLSAICQFWEHFLIRTVYILAKDHYQGANKVPNDWAEVSLFFPIRDLNCFLGDFLILCKPFATIKHLALRRDDSTRRGRGVSWGRVTSVLENAGGTEGQCDDALYGPVTHLMINQNRTWHVQHLHLSIISFFSVALWAQWKRLLNLYLLAGKHPRRKLLIFFHRYSKLHAAPGIQFIITASVPWKVN